MKTNNFRLTFQANIKISFNLYATPIRCSLCICKYLHVYVYRIVNAINKHIWFEIKCDY